MKTKLLTALAVLTVLTGQPAVAQSARSDSTEVIVKGIARPKPADDAAPPPLDIFVKPPRIEHIALSDDGSRFAFVTWLNGLHILTVYNVSNGTHQAVRLEVDSLTAISWLDNDHILLSDTATGIRGTCPSGLKQNLTDSQAISDLSAAMQVGGFGSAASLDPLTAMALQNALSTPLCAKFGVRSQDAATVVDLRTGKGTLLGHRMSDYHNLPLGLPKAVMVDGKMQVMGAFLELRNKSIAGQVAQRVYLWRVDPDTGVGRIVNDRGGDLDRLGRYVDDWLFDSSGKPIARSHYSYTNETVTIEIQKDGKWAPLLARKIVRKEHTFAPFLAGLGRDGTSLLILDAVTESDGARRFHYYELSGDGKLSEALDREDATRDRPIFHPETGALAGFEHEGERATYTFFDPDLAEYYKLAVDTAPGQAVRVAAMARNPIQMILFAQGGDDPGSWHYYDFSNGKRVNIGSQYPSVPAEWVASQRSIRYPAADGLEIRALITLPPKGEPKNRPLVVLPHDGPLGHDARGFDWLAQVLASRGYIVLQPNYRGSDGYGLAFTEAGKGEWSGRMLSDIADGVRHLTKQGLVDAKRVCIAGQGYGGYAALAGAQDGLYRCALAINGISDPDDYAKRARKNAVADDIAALEAHPIQSRAFRADPESPALVRRYFGAQVPPAITAASLQVPVLLVHSERDKSVPVKQSRSLRDDLQKAGKTMTYVELPDCGHDLSTEACRLGTAEAVVDFLAVNNPTK